MSSSTMPTQRAFLLLHGYGNRRPPEHWMHWLDLELRAGGAGVIYPQLPDPDSPAVEVWRTALDAHLDALFATPAAERIVICHSLSCLLWLDAASSGAIPAEYRPSRLLLVSPPDPACVPAGAVGFDRHPPSPAALAASAGTEIRIVGSDSDPYNPGGVELTYARPLAVPFDLIPGGGHISAGDGYGPWPAMLAWCQSPGGPLPAAQAA